MNLEFSLNLADLEILLAKSSCSCHFINPNKTRIILWKEVKDDHIIYYLRIGIQKFVSYPLTDKNGEVYWRFKPSEGKVEKEEVSTSEPAPQVTPLITTPELDPITKFNQRQAKAINHHGEATNHPEQPATTSH